MSRPQNPILTLPSEPSSYDSPDNIYGDLIVARNDIVGLPEGNLYKILGLLGNGQFGQVFKVEQTNSEEEPKPLYAMKITKSQSIHMQQARLEVSTLESIQRSTTDEEKETLLQIKESFVYKNHFCIVQELLGINLYEVIQKRNYRGLPIALLQSVIKQLLIALVAIQRCQIVHSDLKPENVLLVDGHSSRVKMIDFGSARPITAPCSYYIQSRYYRAPEVVLGVDHDFKIDVWSLGCMAVELFVGMPLFPGQSEIHLIELIADMMGGIPDTLRDRSPRKMLFFASDGSLKSEREICAELGMAVTNFKPYFKWNTIDAIVYNYVIGMGATPRQTNTERQKRELLVDLLHKMLEVEPELRISAEEALEHPFITTDLSTIQC